MKISYTVVGQNIRAARERAQLSVQDAAHSLGLSEARYTGMENGTKRINVEQLLHLSVLLKTSAGDLLHGCAGENTFI